MGILFSATITFIISYFKRCRIPTKQEIREYYPHYLTFHTCPINKLFHIFGNVLTCVYMIGVIIFSIKILLLFIFGLFFSPFIVYLGSWIGHYIQGNKPATWKINPILTKMCDWRMMWDLITRKTSAGHKKIIILILILDKIG